MDIKKQISEYTLKRVLPRINDVIIKCLPDTPEKLLKYAKRYVPPKIHSKLDDRTRNMMIEYLLNDEDYLLTFYSIFANSFYKKTKSNKPKLYLVVGQTGSGKSNLTAKILNADSNCIVIDSDKYKSFRPDAEMIATEHPNLYGVLTGIDSYEHRDNVYEYAINNCYNMIVEKAPDMRNGLINVDIEEAIKKGYEIIILVLAVSKLNSALSIHERYEGQIEAKLATPKLTRLDRHLQSFDGLNRTVKNLQSDRRLKIIVYERGIGNSQVPKLIYPRRHSELYNSPYEALIATQKKDLYRTLREFDTRFELIKKQMGKRNADAKQYEQLEEIKKIYDNLTFENDLSKI